MAAEGSGGYEDVVAFDVAIVVVVFVVFAVVPLLPRLLHP